MTRSAVTVFALTYLLAGHPLLRAQDKPLTEKQKIEALIQHVADMKGAKFVRNDTEHDASTAAKFLRGKWQANEAGVKTAKDFIDKVASVSSTSGKPYVIRFQDGKEVRSGEYLTEVLRKLDQPSADKRDP
jgi:hypothetical protein